MTARSVAAVVCSVLAACLFVVWPSPASAQHVGGGAKAGVALGDLPNAALAFEGEPGVTSKQRIGFAAGGFVMVRYDSGFAIQPEFLYTQKGAKISDTTGVADVTIKIDFLDVPVLARYTFGKVVRVYVFGGPSFDFKLSAKAKSGGLLSTAPEEDLGSDVKSFEFAVVFGGGLELGPILLEARWSEGLTNLDAMPTTGSPSLKTRTFLALAGLRF